MPDQTELYEANKQSWHQQGIYLLSFDSKMLFLRRGVMVEHSAEEALVLSILKLQV